MLDFIRDISLWVSSLSLSDVQHVADLILRRFIVKAWLSVTVSLHTACEKTANQMGC